MNITSQEHIRLLRSFKDHDVKFLLIGGHAAIYYGVFRNTGDLDILVQPTKENGIKIIRALEALMLEVPQIRPEEFTKDLVLSFGLEPDAVDILNYTPGIEFDDAFQKSKTIPCEGFTIHIMDIHDLIKNKESLRRPGEKSLLDKYDAEVLKKILLNRKDP